MSKILDSLRSKSHAGLLLFTSGSTGSPKTVVHDLNKLIEHAFSKRQPKFKNKVVLSMLGLDHIGGINTALFCLANQARLVFPESRKAKHVLQAIEKYRVNILPTTPSFLRMILIDGSLKQYDISSLETITYGTEPMDQKLLDKLIDAFPGVKFKQTYGLTETGILSTKSAARDSLWMKIREDMKVVDGILHIKSNTTMVGYLECDEMLSDGWYNTGDRVEIEGEYVKIVGRETDFINVGGEKVDPHKVESILSDMPKVNDISVFGVKNELLGEVVGCKIWMSENVPKLLVKQMIRTYAKSCLKAHEIPVMVEIVAEPLNSERGKKIRHDNISNITSGIT